MGGGEGGKGCGRRMLAHSVPFHKVEKGMGGRVSERRGRGTTGCQPVHEGEGGELRDTNLSRRGREGNDGIPTCPGGEEWFLRSEVRRDLESVPAPFSREETCSLQVCGR